MKNASGSDSEKHRPTLATPSNDRENCFAQADGGVWGGSVRRGSFVPGSSEERSIPQAPGSSEGGSRRKLSKRAGALISLDASELCPAESEETKGIDDPRLGEQRLALASGAGKGQIRSKFATITEKHMDLYPLGGRDCPQDILTPSEPQQC